MMALNSMPHLKIVSNTPEPKKECSCSNSTFDFAAELEKAKKAFSADAAANAAMMMLGSQNSQSSQNSFASLSTQAIKMQIQQSLLELNALGQQDNNNTATYYGKGYNLSLIQSENENRERTLRKIDES
jgi:hypothetical protein